jgi:hypothetical protein
VGLWENYLVRLWQRRSDAIGRAGHRHQLSSFDDHQAHDCSGGELKY